MAKGEPGFEQRATLRYEGHNFERHPSEFQPTDYILPKDITKIDGLDISILYIALSYEEFENRFREIIRTCLKQKQTEPKYELIFLASDLVKHRDDLKSGLRRLKALREGFSANITKIVVKSPDESVIDIEPNVFSSGVEFQKIDSK